MPPTSSATGWRPGSATGWRRSGRCESQQCLEVARTPEGVAVRNSADPSRHILFDGPNWRAFVGALRTGTPR